jgi:heterodisulfide reductase subunit B
MSRYAYFPGCSLSGLGKPYDESLRAVFAHLGMARGDSRLERCGAVVHVHSRGEGRGTRHRNLALASHEAGRRGACAACFLVSGAAAEDYPALGKVQGLNEAGLTYHGAVRVSIRSTCS